MDVATIALVAKLVVELGSYVLGQFTDGKDDEIVIARSVLEQLIESTPEYMKIVEMAIAGELNASMLGDSHKTLEELQGEVEDASDPGE